MGCDNRKVIFYLGGVNGSGKTSVSDRLAQINPDIMVFHSSKLLMKALNCNAYDQLGEISWQDQIKARVEMFNKLFFENNSPILVEGHFLLFCRGSKYLSCIERDWAKNITGFIHIITKPQEIYKRIAREKSLLRHRISNYYLRNNSEIVNQIDISQRLSIKASKKTAKELKKPIFFIDNDSDIIACAQKVNKLFREPIHATL